MLKRILKSKQRASVAGDAERPFLALFKSNSPPTEDQRREILDILQDLREEYRRACGTNYSPAYPGAIPEEGRKYAEEIEYYQSLLSYNRLLPNEILHKIFGYAVLNMEPDHDQIFAIEAIRLVCRGWNASILRCRTLWTHLPLDLRKIAITDNEYTALETARLRLVPYLDRCGNRPISFRFQFWLEKGFDEKDETKWYRVGEVKEWLRMLHFHWGRWGEADFRTSLIVLRQLSKWMRHTSSLDNLTRFSFQLRGVDDSPTRYSPIADTFKLPRARNLRHFAWDTLGTNYMIPYKRYAVNFVIPWGQLDSFEVAVHDGTLIYAQALQKGKNLRVLKFTSATTDTEVAVSSSSESVGPAAPSAPATSTVVGSTAPAQSSTPATANTSTAVPPSASNVSRAASPNSSESSKEPITFPLATPIRQPHLTKLSLCFGSGVSGPTLMEHLASLTLPSLKELEIYWCNDIHSVDLYETILSLVRRSDTSLEKLATENNLQYNAETALPRYQNFLSLLYHCQKSMTHLDIAYLGATELEQLIPERNSARKPSMTKLKTLTVRFPDLQDLPPSDPVPLLRLLRSRTDASRKPPHSHLEDLYIKHDGRDWWRTEVLRLGGQESAHLQIPSDPVLCEAALKWKADLGRDLLVPLQSNSAFSMKRRLEVKLALRGLGSLKLKGRDSRVLIWLGIPALLDRIGITEEGDVIERDHIIAFRRQAKEILDKWKPYLLESFRSSPYRWCFIDNTTSRVRFVEESPHVWISTSAYLDWQRILGKGDVDKWASARKGTAWFTKKQAQRRMEELRAMDS